MIGYVKSGPTGVEGIKENKEILVQMENRE